MPTNLDTVVADFVANAALVHQFVKGDAAVVVVGASGSYPSLAKIAADSTTAIMAVVASAGSIINQVSSQTAAMSLQVDSLAAAVNTVNTTTTAIQSTVVNAVTIAATTSTDLADEANARLSGDLALLASLDTATITLNATVAQIATLNTEINNINTLISEIPLFTSQVIDPDQVLDVFPATSYCVIKYLIQIISGVAIQATELLITHDGNQPYMTEMGDVCSDLPLASFNSSILNGSFNLLVTPFNVGTVIKAVRTVIAS